MEDHEPREERHAVAGQVDAVHDRLPLDAVQVHRRGHVDAELGRQAKYQPRADRDQPEGERLPQHVRPAFALPGPAAQHVAHNRADDPRRSAGDAAGQPRRPEEYDQRDLARRDRGGRHQHKSAEPLAQRGAEPTPQGRDEPGSYECHGSPSCSEDRRVIQSGIQYGNRTLLEVGDLRIAAGPPWRGRRHLTGCANHRGRGTPPSSAAGKRTATLGRRQSRRQTDQAGARS